MPGIRIRHRTKRAELDLVPIISKPLSGDSLHECGVCHVVHPVKTIHLWLDDAGSAIVSRGVYEEMRMGWTGPPEYDVVGEVPNPPPLRIGGRERPEQDQANRALIIRR